MKTIKFFIFFFIVSKVESKLKFDESSDKFEAFSDAIRSVISNYFSQFHSNFNIIKMADGSIDKIVSNVIGTSEGKFSFLIKDYQSFTLKEKTDRRKFISIVVLTNVTSLMKLSELLSTKAFSSRGYFLVAILSMAPADCENVFKAFWTRKFFNVNILVDSMNNLHLWTFMPFSDGSCGVVTPRLINEFNTATKEWKSNDFYPKKFKNLHQCKLVHETTKGAVMRTPSGEYRGKEIDIINEIGLILNFTTEHIVSKSFGNGQETGVMGNLNQGKTHIAAGSLQLDRVRRFTESYPFLSDPLVMIVPPGAAYTSLEKLSRSFRYIVWASILLFLLAVVILSKIVPKRIGEHSLGSDNFILNMISVFLGGSLPTIQLPRHHSTRILMVFFSIYAIVLRTAYSGVVFKNFRSEVKHKEVSNVGEMMDNDFTFYVFESMQERVIDLKFFNRLRWDSRSDVLLNLNFTF